MKSQECLNWECDKQKKLCKRMLKTNYFMVMLDFPNFLKLFVIAKCNLLCVANGLKNFFFCVMTLFQVNIIIFGNMLTDLCGGFHANKCSLSWGVLVSSRCCLHFIRLLEILQGLCPLMSL